MLVLGKVGTAGKRTDRVESSTQHQILECLFVDGLQVDTFHEVENRCELASRLPDFDDVLYGSLSDSFDGGHAETHVSLFIDRKAALTVVDIRTQNRQSHSFTLVHEEADLLDV